MIQANAHDPKEGMMDLIIRLVPPPNDGDPVMAATIRCGGLATPGTAVTVTLFNPQTGSNASSALTAGSFPGNTWSTSLSVNPMDYPGPSTLQAQVEPPDGPVAFITVQVQP
jgi:hypothetical protein